MPLSEMHKEIWVFDFDKTLSKKDTTLPLVLFGAGPVQKVLRWLLYVVLALVQKAGIIKVLDVKRLLFSFCFSGWKQQHWEKHTNEFAHTIRFLQLYQQTNWQNEQAQIYIVSASPYECIRPCFPENVTVLATQLSFKKGKYSGIASHLYGKAKRGALIDMGVKTITRFYSDSRSDAPLAGMAENIFLAKGNELIHCKNQDDFIRKASR
jgi:phosphatidylglycerophosphatase C